MKKSDTADQQSPQKIFSTNFHSEVHTKKSAFFSLKVPSFKLPIVFFISIGFLICTLAGSSVFLLRISPRGENIMGRFSLSKLTSQERQNKQILESKIAEVKTTIAESGKDIDKLLVSGALDSIPELAVARDIYSKKINWFRVYVGIDQVVKQIVSANDILKKITIGSIYFNSTDKSAVLENVRAYGTYYGINEDQKSGTSISLAAGIVDGFEQSAFFKDIKIDDYTRKQEVGSGSTLTDSFTPITIRAMIQDPDETNAKDKKVNIQKELDSLKKNTSAS